MTRPRARVIVQYLEGGAASGAIAPDAAVTRLRRAAERLPIDDVCLGWRLPRPLTETVGAAARELGMRVWLWHPLLSGDGDHVPAAERVIGPLGTPVAAALDLAEFAFDCPVRPLGLAGALERLDTALATGPWDGVFLDKIRWPSPTADPARDLGCLCEACSSAASAIGLDAATVRARIVALTAERDGREHLVRVLLDAAHDPLLDAWLAWRRSAIERVVAAAVALARTHVTPSGGPCAVGLDVFAPSLAPMVGQDIAALSQTAAFTKAMIYLGTHGPAGMAFELARLGRWLEAGGTGRPGAVLSDALGYAVPDPGELEEGWLGPDAFAAEVAQLRRLSGRAAAAGLDAMRVAGLAVLPDTDLHEAAAMAARAGVGIAVSWDAWLIDDARLDLVREGMTAGLETSGVPVA